APLRGNPGRGAALDAPTAPHATPPVGVPKVLTGPARFWGLRRVRIALALTLALSLVAHWAVTPWGFFPDTSGIELKDIDGELSIPVALLGEETPREPAPPPPPVEPAPSVPEKDVPGPNATKVDAGVMIPKVVDAGRDLAEHDAAVALTTIDASI